MGIFLLRNKKLIGYGFSGVSKIVWCLDYFFKKFLWVVLII